MTTFSETELLCIQIRGSAQCNTPVQLGAHGGQVATSEHTEESLQHENTPHPCNLCSVLVYQENGQKA